jgi:hypothetical protein
MKLGVLLALLFSFSSAHAYYSVMDTGKIIPTGKYRIIAGPQFITTGHNDGTNISGRFDAGVGESTTLRATAGGGNGDLFYTGLFAKYIPDVGLVTPYVSLPISIAFADGDTIYPVQLVGGAEFKPYSWENVSFIGELGVKINKAFTYIALGVSFEFSDSNF